MLRKLSFFALISCCAFMLVNADEVEQEHAPVGARAKSEEQRLEQLETRSTIAAMYPEGIDSVVKKSKVSKSAATLGLFKPSLTSSLHPGAYQNAVFFYSPEYHSWMAELTDGSNWFINSFDLDVLSNWSPSDLVIVTQNHAWRSPYHFRLTNQWTGESVAINISPLGPIAPVYGTNHTYWIHDIDYYNNVIVLTQGTHFSVFQMSMFDSTTVNQWIPGDIIFIGVNDGWLFAYNPHLIINFATLDFAVGALDY